MTRLLHRMVATWGSLIAVGVVACSDGATCFAQRASFPQAAPLPATTASPSGAGLAPQTQMTPITRTPSPPPASATLGSPLFDPYQRGRAAGNLRSVSPASPPATPYPFAGGISSIVSGLGATFNGGQPLGSTAGYVGPSPGFGNPARNVAPPPFTATASGGGISGPAYPPPAPAYPPPSMYPPSAYPNGSPGTLFPGGMFGPGGLFGGSAPAGNTTLGLGEPLRLFQGPRLQHTWLAGGDDPADLDINTTDVSIAVVMPNFLWSLQPLYILPSFSLHLVDGPQGAAGGNADLPPQLYDAFLDFGWQSDPQQMVGAELGVRVGVFTDFNTMNSDSLRILGRALGIMRLSPMTTLKAGVVYVDRNRIKLLPAGGILCQPNPYTRFDLTFPDPKISRFFRTVGVFDTWGYIGGEFGGGSWTIERANNASDSIDINDYRVLLGLEWGRSDLIRAGRRTGFAEVGYVFGREVEYRNDPASDFQPNDTFLIRMGIGY